MPDPDDPDCCAQLVVQATVCDVTTSFVLDTGARRSALAPSALVDRLPRAGSEVSSGIFGSVASELVRVPELRLGPLSLSDAALTVAAGADAVDLDGVDGRNLLGMDILATAGWELRSSDATLRIDPPPDRSAIQPLVVDATGHVCVEARFDGVVATCVWDTGAGITVVDARFARAHPALVTELGTQTGTDATLTSRETPIAMLAGCRIGGLSFPPSKAAIVDLGVAITSIDHPVELILGYPLIREADWRFDVPGRGWSVSRR